MKQIHFSSGEKRALKASYPGREYVTSTGPDGRLAMWRVYRFPHETIFEEHPFLAPGTDEFTLNGFELPG